MEKYKICPNPACGKHNKSKAIECAWCETDLSGVKPTDDATEAARVQAENQATEEGTSGPASKAVRGTGGMVRVCESCGTSNPANARKCNSCGEDISDVTPTQAAEGCSDQQGNSGDSYILSSLDGSFSFSVPEGKTLIGREEGLREYLGSKGFVSRKHAEIILSDGRLSIINMSRTNFTYVNNNKIMDGEPVELKNGDEIGLGGNITNNERQEQAAYFIVKAG